MGANKSKIEWTESTWNPVTGCSRVSEGCAHCYAERLAKRLQAVGSPRYAHGFEVAVHDDLLEAPMKWTKPRLIFVNSMSDLFHDSIPLEVIRRIFATMAWSPQHTFQVLTKRAGRLAMLAPHLRWPPNVWMGVTVESADYLYRVELLQQVPAAVRFVSFEPLLGPIPETAMLEGIDWMIAGGESGPDARRMEPEWARGILALARKHGAAFFFKQWGGVHKKIAGCALDGQSYKEMPAAFNQ